MATAAFDYIIKGDSIHLAISQNSKCINKDLRDDIFRYKITDGKKVIDFYSSPQTKTRMLNAGVIGKPDIVLLHVIRFNSGSKEKQWVEVSHQVKNFDAWLKVYDGEGKEKRMAEGMVDVVLARGMADSNMVHLVFDIKDMAKAKAAITSPEKKKLMMSAGVIGMPKIVYYKEVD